MRAFATDFIVPSSAEHGIATIIEQPPLRQQSSNIHAIYYLPIKSVAQWHGMGSKQVGESLRERGKAKLKSGGESHLWHRAMAIEKEVCTLSPNQLHHPPGHGKEPGAMKGVRKRFGELATGNRIGTGADEWACNGFLIQSV